MAIANPALSHAVLPGTPETGSFGLDAQCLDGTDDLFIEVSCAVENQTLR